MDKVKETAIDYCKRSYSPYSQFRVGAAILCRDGSIFGGTNIENSSYSLTMCAERCAMFAAAADGHHDLCELVIYTPTDELTYPCGACLQVASELLEPDAKIRLVNDHSEKVCSLADLLPAAFKLASGQC